MTSFTGDIKLNGKVFHLEWLTSGTCLVSEWPIEWKSAVNMLHT